MQFKVMSEREIKNYKCNKAHIIISIKSPESRGVKIPSNDKRLGTLYLEFHDFDDVSLNYPSRIKLISKEDAKEILVFVAYCPVKPEIVICQCEAGISRSAGIAGALSKIINGDDKAIFRHYLPNMLVYRTIMKEAYKMGMNNKYLETIIEEALAKVDHMEVKKHHNLLGSKEKYIKAILEALKDE